MYTSHLIGFVQIGFGASSPKSRRRRCGRNAVYNFRFAQYLLVLSIVFSNLSNRYTIKLNHKIAIIVRIKSKFHSRN